MALGDLDMALSLKPLNIQARYARAMSLYQIGKKEEALDEIKRFEKIHDVLNRSHADLFYVACLITYGKETVKREESKAWFVKGNLAILEFPQHSNFKGMCEMKFFNSPKLSERECYSCGTLGSGNQCGSCKLAVYCTRECQVKVFIFPFYIKDWKEHKLVCKSEKKKFKQQAREIPNVRDIPNASNIPFDKKAIVIDAGHVGVKVWKEAVEKSRKGGQMDEACELFLHALFLDAQLTTRLQKTACREVFQAIEASSNDCSRVLNTLFEAYSGSFSVSLFESFEKTLPDGRAYGIFCCFAARMFANHGSTTMNADFNRLALDSVKKAAVYGGDLINSITMRYELGWAFRVIILVSLTQFQDMGEVQNARIWYTRFLDDVPMRNPLRQAALTSMSQLDLIYRHQQLGNNKYRTG
jgi:tetratricopeptide (TPR) repeat protein